MGKEHINPAGIPVEQLNPEGVETAAANMKAVGTKVAHQGAVVQKTWHGLAHSYEAPEASKLLTIMDPVKSTTHDFGHNTTLVAKALAAYAVTEQQVKDELTKIKAEAEAFVASSTASTGSRSSRTARRRKTSRGTRTRPRSTRTTRSSAGSEPR